MKEYPLAQVLVVEGIVNTAPELYHEIESQGLLSYTYQQSLFLACHFVVTLYKPASRLRLVNDGLNTNKDSISLFMHFVTLSLNIVEQHGEYMSPHIRAHYLHNAASACAAVNGAQPARQDDLNMQALAILNGVPAEERSHDWMTVATKIGVGLMMTGKQGFDDVLYVQYLDFMKESRGKDLAGATEFYCQWLVLEGCSEYALHVATEILAVDMSNCAPNQLARLQKLADELNTSATTDDSTT